MLQINNTLSGARPSIIPGYLSNPQSLAAPPSLNIPGAPAYDAPTPKGIAGLVNIKPSTPVKSVKVNADGSHQVDFHPNPTPKTTAPAPAAPAPAPITGNATTPSGATVDPTTGQLITPPAPAIPSFPGLVSGAATAAQGNIPIGQSAADIAANYGKQIADVNRIFSNAAAGDLTTGTSPVGQGNANIEYNTASNRIQGLSAAETAALAGTGQQLTAQQQETTGLTGAANAIAPSGNFPFVFNPATGQFSTPGVGGAAGSTTGAPTLTYNPQTDAANLAKAVMNRQISLDDAQASLSYGSNGPNAAAQLNSAILAAGGNPTDLRAQGAGQAAVAGSVPALQAAEGGAQKIQNSIQSLIQQNPNINPANLVASNSVQQWLQGQQLSNPEYQEFFAALTEYANTIAPVLGVGGDPTNMKTQIANSLINAKASGQTISQVLDYLTGNGGLADQKIQGIITASRGGTVQTTLPSGSSLGGWGSLGD